MSNTKWDIVIVGAGLVGTSLACLLGPHVKQYHFSLTLIDPHPFKTENNIIPASDARSLALAYGSQQIYESIGLWDQLKHKATPIEKVHISDKGFFGLTRLSLSNEKKQTLGYVVTNQLIGNTLGQKLNQHIKENSVSMLCPSTVTHLTPTSHGMQVTISTDNSQISKHAHLVIIADGTNSALVKHLGITQHIHAYDEQAIIANVSSSHPSIDTAYKRFSPKGAIALLPAISNYHPLIWTAPTHDANELHSMSSLNFLKKLQKNFGYRIGRFTDVGLRHKFPINSTIAKEQVRPGVIILGNAAHTLHPVAAQGYNLSLRDTLTLANTILDAVEHNHSPGSLSVLQRYITQRDIEHRQIITFINHSTNLFNSSKASSVLARNIGLLAIDACPLLKNYLLIKAIGFG